MAGELIDQIEALWDEQKRDWPMMAKGAAFLAQSETREVDHGGLRVRLQFNPGRVVNASAKVDAKSIAERPCFLCEKNRPAEQRGVDAGDGFVFLCNPMPIFSPHFTVPALTHQPQRIASCLPKLVSLSQALSGRYTVFYNGPKCGASAPDHLHLQASPQGATPFESNLIGNPEGFIEWSETTDGIRLGLTLDPNPTAIVAVGTDDTAVLKQAERLITELAKRFPDEPEPMLNALSLHRDGKFHVALFPRTSHRPSNFGHGPAPKQVLVSPGLVDMLGLLITPRREDYEQLTDEAVAKIYREVSRDRRDLAEIIW